MHNIQDRTLTLQITPFANFMCVGSRDAAGQFVPGQSGQFVPGQKVPGQKFFVPGQFVPPSYHRGCTKCTQVPETKSVRLVFSPAQHFVSFLDYLHSCFKICFKLTASLGENGKSSRGWLWRVALPPLPHYIIIAYFTTHLLSTCWRFQNIFAF